MKQGKKYYIETWAFPYGETYKVIGFKEEFGRKIVLTDSNNIYLSEFEINSHIYINSMML